MDIGHIIGLVLFLAIVGGGIYWVLKHPKTPGKPGSDSGKGDKDDRYNRR